MNRLYMKTENVFLWDLFKMNVYTILLSWIVEEVLKLNNNINHSI